MRVPLLKNEENSLVEYCENGNEFCKDFLLNYYIHRGRYSEALRTHQILFGSRNQNEKDQKRQNLMNNVLLLLPPILRAPFSLPPLNTTTSNAITTISQSTLIRGKEVKNEEHVLNALRENYVNEDTYSIALEDSSITNSLDVENESFSSGLIKTTSFSSTPNSKNLVVKESSPFLQPPYTPKLQQLAT